MVFFTLAEPLIGKFAPFMAQRGIITDDGPDYIRTVTHYGIKSDDIDHVIQSAAEFSQQEMPGSWLLELFPTEK